MVDKRTLIEHSTGCVKKKFLFIVDIKNLEEYKNI